MAKTKTRKLPPGFRFHPTDVELVKFYLKRKILQKKLPVNVVTELNIYKYDPCDLPDKSSLDSRDLKWYFFSAREKKYASGARMKRATESGHWKVTGNDRPIHSNADVVGHIKTLIFHRGRAPKGDRTDWVMHEYRLEDKDIADKGFSQDAFVLCVIFRKEGLGPRNGAQYGAPFAEEEWDEDEDGDDEIESEAEPPAGQSTTTLSLPCIELNKTIVVDPILPQSITHGSSSMSCISETLPFPHEVEINHALGNDISSPDVQLDEDDINMLLSMLKEDGPSNLAESDSIEQHAHSTSAYISPAPCIGGNNMYNSGDPGNFTNRLLSEENGCGFYYGNETVGGVDQMLQGDDDMAFLELIDLETPLNCVTGDCSNAQHTGTDHFITGFDPYLSTEQVLCSSSTHSGSVQQTEQQLCPSSSTHFGSVQRTPVQSCPSPMVLQEENPGWCAQNGFISWQDPSRMLPRRNPGGF